MIYVAAATVAAAIMIAPAAMADSAKSWTWAPIRNDATLDAHLARADFARPNPLPVFATVEAIANPAPGAGY